jgi:CheY-like chemotaxis protein
MGGTIDVQSQLGAGSTFEFTAWFEKVRGAFEPESQSAVPEPGTRPLSILVAEDSAVNRRLIETLLQSAGHHVTAAANGKQALALAESQIFDLVLMDVEMPEMNGLEATTAIRESELRGAHVPIYALTAHALTGDRERCLAGGMDGYLSKPVNIDELLRIVSEVAAQRQAPESSPADLAKALRQAPMSAPVNVES